MDNCCRLETVVWQLKTGIWLLATVVYLLATDNRQLETVNWAGFFEKTTAFPAATGDLHFAIRDLRNCYQHLPPQIRLYS